MSSSTFVPPSPFLRHVTRPTLRSSCTVLRAALDTHHSDRLARLAQMKQNIAQRRKSLQASSNSDDDSSPTKSSLSVENVTSTDNVKANTIFEQAAQDDQTTRTIADPEGDTVMPATSSSSSSSKVSPNIIFRHDVYLPWKSRRNSQHLPNPPIEFSLPHISLFTKGGVMFPDYTFHHDNLTGKQSLNNSNSSSLSMSSTSHSGIPSSTFLSPDATIAEAILSGLNEQQRKAVVADPSRACLVLAGPGSGKTRVLTHRIAYLIKACGAFPSSILAVTFTNKAAAEMKERVQVLLDEHSAMDEQQDYYLTVGTFHWVCARLLRKYGEYIGISSDFNICDTQDARTVISRILNASNAEGETTDSARVSMMAALISKLKNDKEDELRQRMSGFIDRILNFRDEYNARLRSMNMLDFDDLLVETRRMLRESTEVRTKLQNRFQHVLVDEWQDTNNVQFDIVSLLTATRKNLFVVGDVDQSIYKFRGADSGNMQRYTQVFQGTNEIVLVKNYRSTANIISAAKAVIEQDRNRLKRDMVTDNDVGEKVQVVSVPDGRAEAQLIVSSIQKLKRQKNITSFTDCAIMYRTNAQSRLLEEALIQANIPYLLQSGTRFFERKEVKDLVAYLKIIYNSADDNAALRIINVPPRGIGKRTIERIEMFAESRGETIIQTVKDMINDNSIASSANIRQAEIDRVNDFYKLLQQMSGEVERIDMSQKSDDDMNVGVILSMISKLTDYETFLRSAKGNEKENKIQDRIDNVHELIRGASKFTDIAQFLERVTLMLEAGAKNDESEGEGAVWLTTLHGSKGLEFPAVFITGAEDGVIPLIRDRGAEDIEEERRLLYVGMTRAKEFLTISWRSQSLYRKGQREPKPLNLTRFLNKVSGLNMKEIKTKLKNREGEMRRIRGMRK